MKNVEGGSLVKTKRREWVKWALALLVMLALTLNIVHANWNKPFLGYDDADHLKLGTDGTIESFVRTTDYYTYLPISSLSLRLDRALFGPPFSEKQFYGEGINGVGRAIDPKKFSEPSAWATGTRAMNAFYHLLAGVILGLTLLRLGASRGVAFVAAAAWTGHPMACESVCWISERKNVLAALFGFAAMYFTLSGAQRGNWQRFVFAPLLYLLALFSKPTAVGVLPILGALEIFELLKAGRDIRKVKSWLELAAFLALPIIMTGWIIKVNMQIHDVYFVEHPGGTLWTALLTDTEIFFRYVTNIFLPIGLSFFYGINPIVSLLDFRAWMYGLALLIFFVAMIWITRGESRARVAIGILWFFAALGPTANIAPIPFWMQDRYAYISAAGLLLAAIECAACLAKRFNRPRLAIVAGTVFLVLTGIFAFNRSACYIDIESLILDAATREPLSGMAQSSAWKMYLQKEGSFTNAKDSLENAGRIYYYYSRTIQAPDRTNFVEETDVRVKTATVLLQHGEIALARKCLEGWLPPPHLRMHDISTIYAAGYLKKFYDPLTLALGYSIMSQIMLAEAKIDSPAPTESALIAQKKACDDALADVEKAIAIANAQAGKYPGMAPGQMPDWKVLLTNLKAKILIDKATITAHLHDDGGAKKLRDEARGLLTQVPTGSLYYKQAEGLLTELNQAK